VSGRQQELANPVSHPKSLDRSKNAPVRNGACMHLQSLAHEDGGHKRTTARAHLLAPCSATKCRTTKKYPKTLRNLQEKSLPLFGISCRTIEHPSPSHRCRQISPQIGGARLSLIGSRLARPWVAAGSGVTLPALHAPTGDLRLLRPALGGSVRRCLEAHGGGSPADHVVAAACTRMQRILIEMVNETQAALIGERASGRLGSQGFEFSRQHERAWREESLKRRW